MYILIIENEGAKVRNMHQLEHDLTATGKKSAFPACDSIDLILLGVK